MTGQPSFVEVQLQKSRDGEIARVTLNNPKKLNTLSIPIMREFVDKVTALGARDGLRAVVLTGAGDKAFIGGANINDMAALGGTAAAEAFITLVHQTCASLRDLPVPVIGRINGYTLGAGMEVAAACDVRVASTNAVFGMPEVKVGIPSVVEACLLPALIGWGRTRELLIFGENIDAETAYRWGFLEKLVAPDQLDAAVDKWLASLAHTGPQAVRLQKKLIRQWEDLPIGKAVEAGIHAFGRSFATDEPARMLGAFAKRAR